ncbi:histidine kinase [Ignavigranum ruoffiae]|uniref:histidine kinase n=1 Tax=Ignavigranum ruoffiae TaxID=89093 RepID=UPI0024ADDEEC|nr:histidine kinase [Ignavigranum ruoffiae]
MKRRLTDEEVAEIIQARYGAENYHELTKEQEEMAESFNKDVEEYENKLRKE